LLSHIFLSIAITARSIRGSVLLGSFIFSLVPIFVSTHRIHREEHQRGKAVGIPETKVVEEGSAKRNIQRKHDHDPNRKEKKQHGGAGGKGKWNDMDDGTQ
jgi:hypothetical protein